MWMIGVGRGTACIFSIGRAISFTSIPTCVARVERYRVQWHWCVVRTQEGDVLHSGLRCAAAHPFLSYGPLPVGTFTPMCEGRLERDIVLTGSCRETRARGKVAKAGGQQAGCTATIQPQRASRLRAVPYLLHLRQL
jgi:hypothetical protein